MWSRFTVSWLPIYLSLMRQNTYTRAIGSGCITYRQAARDNRSLRVIASWLPRPRKATWGEWSINACAPLALSWETLESKPSLALYPRAVTHWAKALKDILFWGKLEYSQAVEASPAPSQDAAFPGPSTILKNHEPKTGEKSLFKARWRAVLQGHWERSSHLGACEIIFLKR